MDNTYKMIQADQQALTKEKGSKFISYALSVQSEQEFKEKLSNIKSEHPKATHHCYAYRIGDEGKLYRQNDDGEPSGTAGKPILGQIDKLDLTNIAVVVVRYYGGTKLGTSGLIKAYKEGAAEALSLTEKIVKTIQTGFILKADFKDLNPLMNALQKAKINIIEKDFSQMVWLKISIDKGLEKEYFKKLKALFLQLNHIPEEEPFTISGIEISSTNKTFSIHD